jgi:hypothetical protein
MSERNPSVCSPWLSIWPVALGRHARGAREGASRGGVSDSCERGVRLRRDPTFHPAPMDLAIYQLAVWGVGIVKFGVRNLNLQWCRGVERPV